MQCMQIVPRLADLITLNMQNRVGVCVEEAWGALRTQLFPIGEGFCFLGLDRVRVI